MAQISAQMIKDLRDRTGVGMSKCKSALEEADGDMELAISNLRKAGMASAVKKEGRQTNEGVIAFSEENGRIALVEVNAETDFVVQNEHFQQFAKNIAAEVAKTAPHSLEDFLKQPYSGDKNLTIDEYRASVVQKIGENIQIRRLRLIDKKPNMSIGLYSHMGGKIVTVVEIVGTNDATDLARDIGMHVAAASPEFLSPEQIPSHVLEHEKEIARSQMAGKPENVMEKIVAGKMDAYYNDSCLTRQKYIRDDSVTVADFVAKKGKEAGKDLSISGFIRWSVGQ